MGMYSRSGCIRILLFTLIFAARLASVCYADDCKDGGFEATGLALELGGGHEPDIIGGTIGAIHNADHSSIILGFSFFAAEAAEDLLTGISIKYEYAAFRNKFSFLNPYVGIGAFGGIATEKVNKENDHIDNDDDGLVDEVGEEEDTVTDAMFAAYPEVGIHLTLAKPVVLSLAARYYFTTKGDLANNLAYLLGINLFF